MIVAPSADLDLATRAVLFSAAGTAGQRCTTLRRVIAHESIRAELTSRVERAYAQIRVGDPREATTLVGPLIDSASFEAMQKALDPG
jgi:aldehyde dehydrogenase (NAD+)